MGLTAAKIAAPAAETADPQVRRSAMPARQAEALSTKSCGCGEAATLTGRCQSCEGLSLKPRRAAPGGFVADAPRHDLSALDLPAPAALTPIRAQTHLRVAAPDDAAEREAQDMGRKVAFMPAPSGPADAEARIPGRAAPGLAQRHAIQPLMASPAVVRGLDSTRSAGAPLPAPVRAFMEPRFGADFSGVRIHTGPEAASMGDQLNAHAFTVGRDIYFNRDQYRPDSDAGRELIAHELTHTIQQGGAIQRAAAETTVAQRSDETVHRSIWDDIKSGAAGIVNALGDPLAFLADKANMIPGFRLLTIVIGANPITMAKVDPTAANILMAMIEFIPGGGFITQALQNSGVFDKVGNWIAAKIKELVATAGAIKSAVTEFIGSLKAADIADPGGVWARAKRIFTEPIDRLIGFCKGVITDILKFVKDAILLPLARLAERTPSWDLLCAVLGRNPITDEKVDGSPEVLIGGFMKLIGQEDIWKNMQQANAIPRAFAWFKGAMAAVKGFVNAIPGKFRELFNALTIEDVVLVAGALKKVAGVFGGFVGSFISWGLNAAWDLLEIIFDVVSPGAFAYVKKTGAALHGILKNPLPFVGNLVKAAKLGFTNFADNIGDHLKKGLIDWLTGSLPGVYIPKAFSLPEFGKLAISVLGLSWAQIRAKIVKALGPRGETIMAGLELAFDVVKALVTGGVAAAWELVKEKLTNLKDMVIDAIVGFVKSTIIEKAIPKLIAMFIPGAGFISAIVSIYDTIKVFIEKLSAMAAVVKSFVDSIVAIASGEIGGAAKRVEGALGGMLSLAISFLAGFLGLGNISAKIRDAIKKVQDVVDKGLDTAINWIVGKAKAMFANLFGGKDKDDKSSDPNALEVEEPVSIGAESHEVKARLTPKGLSIEMASTSFAEFSARLDEFKKKKTDELLKLNLESVVKKLNSDVADIKSIAQTGAADPNMTKIEKQAAEKKMRNLLGVLIGKLKDLGVNYAYGSGAAAKVGDTVRLDGNLGAIVTDVGVQIVNSVGIKAKMNSGTVRPLLYDKHGQTGMGGWELVAPGKKPAYFTFTGSPGGGQREVRGVDKLYPPGSSGASVDPPGLNAPTKSGAPANRRGHLVANMFGGPGGHSNIVAMTIWANHTGMKALEDVARDAIVNKGQIINYRATPSYSVAYLAGAPDAITVDFDIQDVAGNPVPGGKSGTVPNQ